MDEMISMYYIETKEHSYLSRFLQTGRIEINFVQIVLDVNARLETILSNSVRFAILSSNFCLLYSCTLFFIWPQHFS